MISSAVYRFRAMLPPFAGRNLNSRSGLVYRGQVNSIEKYLVPSRELLAVLQLWRASQQIVFRYDVIPGPKVFETQIHGKRFEMYNDTVLGFNKSGKEVARIQVEEPIYIRPA